MMKTIFAIAGHAGSGKNTLANLLSDRLSCRGIPYSQCAFADHLKEQAKYHGWNGEKDQKGRTLLQELGDTLRHYHGDSYYARYLAGKIIEDRADAVLVTDTRYLVELAELKKTADLNGWKFVSIRVCRNADNGMTAEQKAHSSENELDEIPLDYTVCNNGTIEDLDFLAGKIVEDVFGGNRDAQ